MNSLKNIAKVFALTAVLGAAFVATSTPQEAEAGYGHRQYYSSWAFHTTHNYHYRTFYYKPYVTYTSYHYHYCIYQPQSRYVYFYNPVRRVYWGRFDTQGKEGAQYSLLAEKDRSGDLKAIPEAAFPAPGAMPSIPGAEDGVLIKAIKDLPVSKK